MPNSNDNRKRRERRRRANERRKKQGAEEFAAYFSNWADDGERYRREVRQAVAAQPLAMIFQKQKGRPPSTLTLDEIGVVLLAVEGYGASPRGISYVRMKRAYKITGQGYQRSKVAACFRILVALGIIEKCGNYSKGRKGNKYRRVACQLKDIVAM